MNQEKGIKHSDYLKDVFSGGYESLRATVDITKALAKLIKKDFSHVACTGVSGMSIAPCFALEQQKGLIVIRKTRQNSHAEVEVEGCPYGMPFNYVIVDDFMCSGATVARILENMNYMTRYANCLGGIGYHYKEYHEFKQDFIENLPNDLEDSLSKFTDDYSKFTIKHELSSS